MIDSKKARFSAIFCNWHGVCSSSGMVDGWSAGRIWRLTMTLSFNLQSLLVSALGALIASSLFLSAAIGPVPVI